MNFICFDLEGPLSPQDNAYELMKLFPQGDKVFEAISRYDDILALEGREGYEPGDTLAIIVPFLLYHDISEEEIRRLAERATLIDGARELIAGLNSRGWRVFCISTSYKQYAHRIAQRLGIAQENIACTHLPLDQYRRRLSQRELAPVGQLEKDILAMHPLEDDWRLGQRLDSFFWLEPPNTNLGAIVKEVKPMGGQRKVEALKGFAASNSQPLAAVIAIGDSITDFKMLNKVNEAGGLAIAFNANEYALPYSTMGLASTNLGDLRVVTDAWESGGREAVEAVVRDKERAGGRGDREHFHWLVGREDLGEPIEIHKRIRRLVRQEAGKLG